MEQFYDKDGTDITATVTKKIDDAKSEVTKTFEAQIAEKDTKIKELTDGATDVTKVKEEADKKIADLTKDLDTFKTNTVAEKRAEALKRVTGGNKELTDKIEAELKALNLPMDSAENIESAMTKASAIVLSGLEASDPLRVAMGRTGGRGTAEIQESSQVETADQRKTRIAMGITDAKAAKYADPAGPKPLILDKIEEDKK